MWSGASVTLGGGELPSACCGRRDARRRTHGFHVLWKSLGFSGFPHFRLRPSPGPGSGGCPAHAPPAGYRGVGAEVRASAPPRHPDRSPEPVRRFSAPPG